MRKTMRLVVLLPLLATLSLSGPPGGGHSSGGSGAHSVSGTHAFSRSAGSGTHIGPATSLSGPAPIGASGPPPLGAAGSLRYGNGTYGRGTYAGTGRRTGRYPYGYYPGPFVLPYYGYDGDGNGYYDSGDYGPGADYDSGNGDTQALMRNQDALGHQVQQLTAEIEDMRDQQQAGPQQPLPNGAAAAPADSESQNDVPITIVLRSGQQLNVKNYAVTDGVFWDFSKHPAQKILVSTIDIAASEKATAANGGEFPPITQ